MTKTSLHVVVVHWRACTCTYFSIVSLCECIRCTLYIDLWCTRVDCSIFWQSWTRKKVYKPSESQYAGRSPAVHRTTARCSSAIWLPASSFPKLSTWPAVPFSAIPSSTVAAKLSWSGSHDAATASHPTSYSYPGKAVLNIYGSGNSMIARRGLSLAYSIVFVNTNKSP